MSIRSILRQQIISDAEIAAIIPEDLWISASDIKDDNRPTPAGPFAVIRLGTASVGMGRLRRIPVEIWVHDEPGTYETIDRVLHLLHARLDGVVHLTDSSNSEVVSSDWVSDSGDLYDPGYRTIVKTTSYNLIGKGV